MSTTHSVPTDSPKKITVDSQLIYALWQQGRAYAGFNAQFEVKTLLVGDGGKVKATLRTAKGKKLDKVEGVMTLNRWRGTVVIPQKVQPGDCVYLEVELPKHGLSIDSNEIPVRSPIEVASIKWSKTEIAREEEVTLTCIFTNGVEDGDRVMVKIFEYDNDGNHDPVVTIPTDITGGKVELTWKFIYQEDTDDIPTEAELKKYGKSYNPPEYFFVVLVDTVAVGNRQESGLLSFKDTIDLVIRKGRIPAPSKEQYTITMADGTESSHTPDDEGKIVVEQAVPGPFLVNLADDTDAEKAAGAAQFKTGSQGEYLIPEVLPLIDGHMHIQSNNCCPLPVQLGILARKAGFLFGRPVENNRKDLLDTMCAWYTGIIAGRFGKVGRLSSDLVGKLYMNDLCDMDMKTELYWTVFDNGEEAQLRKKKKYNSDEKIRRKAGEMAGLSDMGRASKQSWQEHFLDATAYYFENTTIAQMCMALTMDLSFTHYWGRFGLPVYLDAGNDKYFINDFAAIGLKRKGLSDHIELTFEEGVVTPESDGALTVNHDHKHLLRERATVHLHASFTEHDRFGKMQPSFYQRLFELSSSMHQPDDDNLPLLKFTVSDAATSALAAKRYVHFLAEARGEEKKWFEDYAMQRELTVASMVNYPLSFFGGYHYDPRRHLLGEAGYDAGSMAENLLRDHVFFTARHDAAELSTLTNGVVYEGAVMVTPHEQLNTKACIQALIQEHQRTTFDAMKELFPYDESGMFWCVKLYPRLGWAPDDFARYPNLETLYTLCGKKVPIIVHCSCGGMAAPDYYLYKRYDDHIIKDEYKLKEAEDRFDGLLPGTAAKDSPVQWKNVLVQHPDLKICLAHFGGYDTWKRVGDFERAEKKLAKRGNETNPDGYDDCDYYRDWIKCIAEMVEEYDNVYTDISYFKNSGSFRSSGNSFDDDDDVEYSRLVAHNLVYLLKKYPGLKNRISIGTDWLMIELERENSIGEYMARMFETLREVSREVGYDAWHQFVVINPMKFLGLIDEAKEEDGPFEVKVEGLEKFGELLLEKVTEKDTGKSNPITVGIDDINETVSKLIKDFSKNKISSSSDISINGKLLILKDN